MKKDDNISIILSVIINVIILLLIPKLSVKEVVNKKIKVGLIAYDNNNKTKLEGKNNSNAKNKKIKEKVTQQKEEKKKVEQPKPKPQPKKDPNKVDLAALNNVAKAIATPELNVLAVEKSNRKTTSIQVPDKEFVGMKTPLLENHTDLTKDVILEKEPVPEKIEELNFDKDQLSFNSQSSEDIQFDRILDNLDSNEGLPSGYKLGTEDGDIVAKWDTTNREPIYPEIAQVKGLHGTVKIKMFIDENGDVKNLSFEKGSGVPEINAAIEQVGRTWKIYLSKNGLNVAGDVILEYKFILN